jgi:hypothetical protein
MSHLGRQRPFAIVPPPTRPAAGRLRLGVAALLLFAGWAAASPPRPTPAATVNHWGVPVLAHYYIWFDSSSWDRAKIDLPALGAYSSDDPQVMRQQVAWAQQAGIDGFIVSWKSTPTLNRRLQQLMEIADAADFKLSIIYEGLDFNRDPLPATQVAADFDYFLAHFASDKAFSMFPKPLMIWSGTWKFSPDEVAQVTSTRRDRLTILASEKGVADYQRLADVVDGDMYYWSSVDAATNTGYQAKLNAMAAAIHANNGLWVAPAAPGFDARLVGGTQTVDRKDGQTLRDEMTAAMQSSPDVIGLISWNEFSENSYIEPSQKYGRRYLDVLTDILSHPPPAPVPNPADRVADPQNPAVRYFPAVGHTLRGVFRAYWEQHGALAQFGYPLTEEFQERSPTDGKQYTVQYLERNRFEAHPENAGTPYEVLLGLLGRTVTANRTEGAAFALPANALPGTRFFPQTGHTLAPQFAAFWDEHGGLPVYGYPISEALQEQSPTDGKTYLVQYFERNRLEYHPELPAPFRVSLGLLGVQVLQARGWIP